jgi:methylmalonyl-CoA mutase
MTDAPFKFGDGFPKGDYGTWRALAEKTLGGKSFEKALSWKTSDGIAFNALSVRGDTEIRPQPVRVAGQWLITSSNWSSDSNQVNANILEDLERGASAIAVTVDDNGLLGLKPSDLSRAFDGVYLDMVPFSLIHNGDFSTTVAEMAALLSDREYGADQISGALGIDPIGASVRSGGNAGRVADKIAEGAAFAKSWSCHFPRVRSFLADATVFSNAGASEATEISAAMATAVAYLRAMETAGLAHDIAARQISFTFAASSNQWLTIAKFRAARRVWQQILAACSIFNTPANLNAISAVNMISQKDPSVNILRATSACFGAVIGGADSVTTLPHDLMLGDNNKFSRRIARNIQIILQEESNLAKVSDPAAGSYALEAMTSALTEKALAMFQDIEQKGGILSCLRSGWLQGQVKHTASQRQKDIRTRKVPLTGVSEFPNIDEAIVMMPHSGNRVAPKENKDKDKIEKLPMLRLSQEFENLRFVSDTMLAENGTRPSIFLANIGNASDFTGRATFAKNFYEAGGIAAIESTGGTSPEEIAAAFQQSQTSIAILCSSDALYQDHACEVATVLKAAGCKLLFVAGKPSNLDELKANGVDDCIYMGCDVIAANKKAYSALGYDFSGETA